MLPKKTAARIVYAAFVAISAWFIVSSTVQIMNAVFGFGAANPKAGRLDPSCASALRSLADAVDRGMRAGAASTDPRAAEEAYAAAKNPEWAQRDELLKSCNADAHAKQASAALLRLDRVALSTLRRHSAELGPVRREVDSFIR